MKYPPGNKIGGNGPSGRGSGKPPDDQRADTPLPDDEGEIAPIAEDQAVWEKVYGYTDADVQAVAYQTEVAEVNVTRVIEALRSRRAYRAEPSDQARLLLDQLSRAVLTNDSESADAVAAAARTLLAMSPHSRNPAQPPRGSLPDRFCVDCGRKHSPSKHGGSLTATAQQQAASDEPPREDTND